MLGPRQTAPELRNAMATSLIGFCYDHEQDECTVVPDDKAGLIGTSATKRKPDEE
jgi:hypothetical protein